MSTSETTSTTTWAQLAIVAAVAASHMSMPNHWLPYSLVARAHSWTLRKTLSLTAIGAVGHATVTMLVVLAIFGMSNTVISHDMYNILSSIVLLSFGLYYLITYILGRRESISSCCNNNEEDEEEQRKKLMIENEQKDNNDNVSRAAALSVVSLTTFSPCVGSMPILATVITQPIRIFTVLALWFTLTGTAVAVMVPLVGASFVGVQYAFFNKVRKHERLILGLMLIALAGMTLLLDSHDHDHHHHDSHHGISHMSSSPVQHANCGGHDKLKNSESIHDADVVKGGMNVVINGKKGKFGESHEEKNENIDRQL